MSDDRDSLDGGHLIAPEELKDLQNRYGPFSIIEAELAMESRSLRFYRKAFKNRRGEILFVLRRPNGDLLLHTKHKYPPDLYRIPGGGIDWGELVPASLRREPRSRTATTLRRHTCGRRPRCVPSECRFAARSTLIGLVNEE